MRTQAAVKFAKQPTGLLLAQNLVVAVCRNRAEYPVEYSVNPREVI